MRNYYEFKLNIPLANTGGFPFPCLPDKYVHTYKP